jgi:hypothetical protein
MEKFFENLKTQAEENPLVALGISVALITAISKLIDATGHAAGSRAYARQIDARLRKTPQY